MKETRDGVTVTILGKEFMVACPEDERAALAAAAGYLDKKMREIRDTGKVAMVERIAIMAALNIAHELLTTRVPGGFDIGEFKRRIAGMEATLDQAVAGQDELF